MVKIKNRISHKLLKVKILKCLKITQTNFHKIIKTLYICIFNKLKEKYASKIVCKDRVTVLFVKLKIRV